MTDAPMWCCENRGQDGVSEIEPDDSRSCKVSREWIADCELGTLGGSRAPVIDEVQYDDDEFNATEYTIDPTYEPDKITTSNDIVRDCEESPVNGGSAEILVMQPELQNIIAEYFQLYDLNSNGTNSVRPWWVLT